jgi:hypothetical protein
MMSDKLPGRRSYKRVIDMDRDVKIKEVQGISDRVRVDRLPQSFNE